MEPLLARRYQKATGIEVTIPNPEELPMVHQKYTWYLGSPDGLAKDGGVDFKTTSRRQDYGEPGTDAVPDWVACQAHWYMGLTGAKWWDIAVLFFAPRRLFEIYRLNRNEDIISRLTQAGREFWENHVVPRIPPPIDSSQASRTLLNLTYPFPKKAELLPAPELAEKIFARLLAARKAIASAEEEKVLAENQLKQIIGDASGLEGRDWKITWKKARNQDKIDYKMAINQIMSRVNIQTETLIKEILANNTTSKPAPRILKIWTKEESS